MKKLKKIMLTSGVMLALSTGVVTSYLMAQQPRTPQEDLTLANIEAMARGGETGATISGCLGLWGECTLPDGTTSQAPAVSVQL